MKLSHLVTRTSKDIPSDETSRNAQLLIKAGYIFKTQAGAYSLLPLGLRVIKNIENIVRTNMNSIGGQEVLMNSLQPKQWWLYAGSWDHDVNDVLFHLPSLNLQGTEYALASSHEENATNIAKQFINSYKDLPVADANTTPLSLYQIQTKFRDELRSKAGMMRGREFIMKDMYDFHRTKESQNYYFEVITQAYIKIFAEIGLKAYVVDASGGAFTKKFSREFQVICEAGEDTIMYSESTGFACNSEVYQEAIKVWTDKHNLPIPSDIQEARSAEVGNIFDLGTRYTEAFSVQYTDENNQKQTPSMGCHGIGITRSMGVIAELFSDDKGLSWPESVTPYKYSLLTITNTKDSDQTVLRIKELADKFYLHYKDNVLYDDRETGFGQKMGDAELMGCPYIVIISPKNLENNVFEIKTRATGETTIKPLEELLKI
jgi:prolyl-tRNA synthetase